MKLLELIADWRFRLQQARRLRDELDRGYAWIWEIRARILRFLLSRYVEHPDPGGSIASQQVPTAHPPSQPLITFCVVLSADGPPPRSGEAIGSLLRDIKSCNRRGRSRWVWGLLPRLF